jgi:hypothetical protein
MADALKFTPWGLKPVSPYIEKELKTRAASYGMSIPPGGEYDSSKANGPKTAWIRVCSNAVVPKDRSKMFSTNRTSNVDCFQGFVLDVVDGFKDTYGLGDGKETILGRTPDGKGKHVLYNGEGSTFPHRPSPGVTSIEGEFYGAGAGFNGLCRKVTIHWRANSLDQLNYLLPYFLSPQVSVVIEWGWNHYNEPGSLIDLTDLGVCADSEKGIEGSGLRGLFTNSQLIYKRIEKSQGNYDCHIGKIFDYSITLNSQGGFDCTTVVVNAAFLAEGMSTLNQTIKSSSTGKLLMNFNEFIGKEFNNIGRASKNITDPELKAILSHPEMVFSTRPYIKKGDDVEDGTWIRMELLVMILNKYFSITLPSEGDSKTKILELDIKDVKICAHPFLKSTDRAVLVPNVFAPKIFSFGTQDQATNKGTTIGEVKSTLEGLGTPSTVNTEYPDLLSKLSKEAKLGQSQLSLRFDDLNKIINHHVGNADHAFPQLRSETDCGKAGYWGYLKDLYVSVNLVKEVVESNDNAVKIIETILNRMSSACANIWKFRIAPFDTAQNNKITVHDENYFQFNTSKAADTLPVFKIGSVQSAHFTEIGMNIQMKQEMAAQSILGQSAHNYRSPKNSKPGETDTSVDVQSSLFLYTDRMFDTGHIATTQPSNNDIESENKEATYNRGSVKDFLTVKEKGITYFLTEKDPELMKSLVKTKVSSGVGSTEATYLTSPIMPGTEITLSTQGIGGFRFLDMFTLEGVPEPYSRRRAVWQIESVKGIVENNSWKTVITAKVRPITILEDVNQ